MEAIAQDLWLLMTNPNVSFWLLVLGLWAVVLAVSLPGTGLAEATAVVSLALASVGLLQLPVNLVGFGLILVALGLFLAEFPAHAHGVLLLSGALALGIGAAILYGVGGRSPAHLSWFSVLAAPLITTVLFGLAIRKALAAQHAPALQDLSRLIGSQGVARTEVHAEGTVYAAGELWSAISDRPVPTGTKVIVLDRTGLVLKVAPAPVPDAPGTPAPTKVI